jgi:hypothetical protein
MAQNMRSGEGMSTRKSARNAASTGADELRMSAMMANLLDALDQGKDIGHYGRLVFAMVGRHFLGEDDLVARLTQDDTCSEEEARALVHQVISRDYNPPRRERILEWQRQQDFLIILNPDDPDDGNVYRDLTFPDGVYEDIEEYHEQKAEATS